MRYKIKRFPAVLILLLIISLLLSTGTAAASVPAGPSIDDLTYSTSTNNHTLGPAGQFAHNEKLSVVAAVYNDKTTEVDVQSKHYWPPPLFKLALEADPEEGGMVGGEGWYTPGTGVQVSASANEGYTFVNWTYCEPCHYWPFFRIVEISNSPDFTYTMPACNVSLTANFEELPTYSLTLTANPTEGGTVDGGGSYAEETQVDVSASANEGYTFVNWTYCEPCHYWPFFRIVEISNSPDFTYTMPACNVSLTANFEELPPDVYTLTLTANPEEGGTVDGDGSYAAGTEVNVSAAANEGYTFVNWTDEEGTIVSFTESFTYIMPENDVSLTANFAGISITKDGPETAKAGDTIEYTLIVKNVGGVYLFDIKITDPIFGSDWEYDMGALGPDESTEPIIIPYAIPADQAPGEMLNEATATGFYYRGEVPR